MSNVKTFAKGSTEPVSAHYKVKDFDCKCDGYCTTTLIDMDLVLILEKLCTYFGIRFNIKKAYACKIVDDPDSRSYHLTGQAVDIDLEGVDLDGREDTLLMVPAYAEFLGATGIGLYTKEYNESEWVHIDLRTDEAPRFWQDYEEFDGFGGDQYQEDADRGTDMSILHTAHANYTSSNPPPQLFQEKNPIYNNHKSCQKIKGIICHFIDVDQNQPYLGKFIQALDNNLIGNADIQQDWDWLLGSNESNRNDNLNHNFNQPYYHAYIGKLSNLDPNLRIYNVKNIYQNAYISIQTLPWTYMSNCLTGNSNNFTDEGWIHIGIYNNTFSYEIRQELRSLIKYLNELYGISPYKIIMENDIAMPQVTTQYELQLLGCLSEIMPEPVELSADFIRDTISKNGGFYKDNFYSYRIYDKINIEQVYSEFYGDSQQKDAQWYYEKSNKLIFSENKLTSRTELWEKLKEQYGALIVSYIDAEYKFQKILIYADIKYQKNDLVIFRINHNSTSYDKNYPFPSYLQNSILYISKPLYSIPTNIKGVDLTTYYNGPSMFTVPEHYIRKATINELKDNNRFTETVQLKPNAVFITGNKVPMLGDQKFYKIFSTVDFMTIGTEMNKPLGIIDTNQIQI